MIISVFDRVENNVGKRENASYQHFLLFPQCFQKVSFPEASNGVIVWERVNSYLLANKDFSRSIDLFQLKSKHRNYIDAHVRNRL